MAVRLLGARRMIKFEDDCVAFVFLSDCLLFTASPSYSTVRAYHLDR